MALVARIAAVLPIAGAVTAAVALTGAAVFTVAKAGCADPGHYVRHDNGVVELVGGCTDQQHLPVPSGRPQDRSTKDRGPDDGSNANTAGAGQYRP
ncbi:hypothetical protein [Goodfellowiella coeruleoviolacea]|uniref:Secreted protein n=1 Tax=Goodfellowiella coeruleoviolacea TaxID=334858 RepID=A0AAE3KGC0_9PSEU|nr:hypothetical protein [Goodfellowiella coeruleoviolacea]MCP2165697.1 hypothetical protein [Goodfellowiella coeruleoviolacea]